MQLHPKSPQYPAKHFRTGLGLLAMILSLLLATTATAQTVDEKTFQTSNDTEYRITRDYVYGHKDGMALTFDVLKPVDANGIGVCFMVSGGWYSIWSPPEQAVKLSLFGRLLDSGYTVFMVRHGSAPRFKVPEAVDDVRKAIETIQANAKTFEVDPQRLGVCGGSAGGHLSTMLGTTGNATQRCAAVACYYPPTDLRPYVSNEKFVRDFPALDFDKSQAEAVSPALHATDDDAPTLLIHGDKDELVPLSHSEDLKRELDKVEVPCELIVIEGAAHGFAGKDKDRAEEAVVAWFDKYLKKDDQKK